jgi:hypothetical protein
MTFRFVNRKRRQTRLRPAHLAIAGLAALIAAGDPVHATDRRGEHRVESIETRTPGEPILAIVSLRDQRITVYDADGWILRAPVSSGQKERETPAGIFSVIEKDAEHHSNLYDDAYMPHMQRITWSGIALHGGPLPGYPASHGCVRMPFDFAGRLFDTTQLGLRVIVAPTEAVPIEIDHPVLFQPKPGAGATVAARIAEADAATGRANQTRLAAGTALRESVKAMVPVRTAENLKRRAEAQLAAAEAALGSPISAEAEQAERDKAQAVEKIAALQVQLTDAKAEQQPKLDAVTRTREAAAIAEAERSAAAEAARVAARELEPVSVLISRKTQRLYVRQGFEPILESPVTILDTDSPLGTHVFTAMRRANSDNGLRWSVVSLASGRSQGGVAEPKRRAGGGRGRDVQPPLAGPGSARAALDRIVIPQDVLDHIGGMAPRSSLIITDEALSSETGKGTEFVVLLSGEPQGGIKIRPRSPAGAEFSYARQGDRLPYWRPPSAGSFSSW